MFSSPRHALILVAVLDAAEDIALDLHLFAALDEPLLALPVHVVDVFLGPCRRAVDHGVDAHESAGQALRSH